MKKKFDFFRTFKLDPPKIMTAFDSNLSLIEESNESIVCHAFGTPYLSIYWKMGETIFPSNKLQYDSVKRVHNEVDDQLNFTCVAENQFGNDFRTVSFKLIGKM